LFLLLKEKHIKKTFHFIRYCMSEENHRHYVCSRGILKSCDIFSSTPISGIKTLINYNFQTMTKNQPYIIYICISALPFFIHHVLHRMNCPFILVTGDNDETCPNGIFQNETFFHQFLDSPQLVHWFSQNLVGGLHPKLTQIPIGLDYHTLSNNSHHVWGKQKSPLDQEKELQEINAHANKPFWERELKAHANFHFAMYSDDRVQAKNKIAIDLVCYELNQQERRQTWIHQTKFAFVISPHGMGMDCHRTWEALCLGCIPIVKTSPLNSLYDGLPVLILNDWSDLTEELMQSTVLDFKDRQSEFQMEKLTLKYWVDLIHSYKCETITSSH